MQRLSLTGCALLLCATVGFAQLRHDTGLLRYDSPLEYEDYAREGYKPYTAGVFSSYNRPQFDELGNFLIDGRQLFHLEEQRGQAPRTGSRVEKLPGIYQDFVGRLVVGYDSYKTWSSRLIIGDRIRTKFTSLTLDLVALNGIRWDWDMNGNLVTFVTSRVDWPNFSDTDNDYNFAGSNKDKRWATYLIGGHVERKIGALKIGGSYVNQHRINSLVDWGDNSLKGVQPAEILQDGTAAIAGGPPFLIAVKFSDGSDLDGRGARVFDVRIEGELDHIQPLITRHNTDVIDPTSPDVLQSALFPRGKSVPPYLQFLRGELPLMDPQEQGFFEANGTDFLIYWFEIPQEQRVEVQTLHFKALVANDYRISVADVHRPSSTVSNSSGLTQERVTYFHDVAEAKGNVQDMANLRWVNFEYGRSTGRTIVSLRADLERKGFEVTSEFARSYHYLQYPSPAGFGEWQTEISEAYFVNAKKQFLSTTVGAEYFRIAPRYSTVLSVQDQEFFRYAEDLGSPFPSIPGGFLRGFNNTLEVSTVDDNDDRDRRPDSHFLEPNRLPNPFSGVFGDDNGVFPGLDVDQDGRNDTDENANGVPDYLEAFFLYHVDPPEYDWGEDLNNNGFIDHREDDREPDYPYNVDRKGYHLFVGREPAKEMKLTLGHYNTREIWGEGRSRSVYAEWLYRRSLYPFAVIDLANKLKRVEDDVRDDYVRFNVDIEDELLMRDSVVNTAYIDATFLKIENLKINNRLKYAYNFQRSSSLQEENAIGELSWVLRGEYTWRLGALRIIPRFKYRAFVKKDREDELFPVSERFFYPILLLGYALTDNTEINIGAQGFPFLKSTFRDRINDGLDWDREDYAVQITNRTTYSGHHLSLNMGYQLQRQQPKDERRTSFKVDRSLLFIRLIMGLEPFEG